MFTTRLLRYLKPESKRPRRKQTAQERRSAFRPRLEMLEDRTLLRITLTGAPPWLEQGPGPTLGGQTEGIGLDILPADLNPTNPVSGAIQAIAADPANANRIFVGTVNGGIWR